MAATFLVVPEWQGSASSRSMVRIICAVLAVLFLGLIVLRRKKSAE